MKKITKSLQLNKEVITRLESANIQGGGSNVCQQQTEQEVCTTENTCVSDKCTVKLCPTGGTTGGSNTGCTNDCVSVMPTGNVCI